MSQLWMSQLTHMHAQCHKYECRSHVTHLELVSRAAHCNTLQHTTHCNTLQHTTTHCNTLQHTATHLGLVSCAAHCNTLQHTATHCNTLQHMSHTLDWCCVPSATGKWQHMNELPHICWTREWVMSHIHESYHRASGNIWMDESTLVVSYRWVTSHITYMIGFIHRASGNIWINGKRQTATYGWMNPVT